MSDVNIIDRATSDEFSFDIFLTLLGDIDKEYHAIYMWPPPIIHNRIMVDDNFLLYLKEFVFTHDLIILGIKDHLIHHWYNLHERSIPNVWDKFEEIFSLHPNKQFIIFTSLEKLKSKHSNVKIISWGGDITNQQKEYTLLNNSIKKNFNSNFSYISLNNTPRLHRALSVIVQFALDLNKFGIITFSHSKAFKQRYDLNDLVSNENTYFYKFLLNGLSKAKNHTFDDTPIIYPPNHGNDNVRNFKYNLINYYNEVFVEVVSETTFNEPFMFTEKLLNSVYGCNFPIILSNAGAVEHLREMGMDVFDDIIDHSYQYKSTLIERCWNAIFLNRDILENFDLAKSIRIQCADRLISNRDLLLSGKLLHYCIDCVDKMPVEYKHHARQCIKLICKI
jgi:hypothetical protein